MVRVVHYINQFFAGIGGEDKADHPLSVVEGPLGPGVELEKELKGEAKVVATIYAGDNYVNENSEKFLSAALGHLKEIKPDVIVGGPAFSSGRHGIACGMLLKEAEEQLGIPGVVGCSRDNPAVEMYRDAVYIVPTANSAVGMSKALPPIARLALRLGRKVELGSAREEGYLPRGIRKNVLTGKGAAVRAIEMGIARLKGEPYLTELVIPKAEVVDPPAPINDLSKAVVALVTEGGLVPKGNPDRLESWDATKWFHYPMKGDSLKKGDYEVWHGGVITEWVDEDPNRNVPLDAMRYFEKTKFIGRLYEEFCVTVGNMSSSKTMQKLGKEIAVYLKEKGVDAVILTAT